MKNLLLLIAFLGLVNVTIGQTITVTSPNGGENLAGCTIKTVTWSSSLTSNFYSIDYSTDGGTSWASVTSFYNTTGGSYNWTVPNVSSSTCLIRVQDSNTPSTTDESNSNFTITYAKRHNVCNTVNSFELTNYPCFDNFGRVMQ